MNDTSRRAKTKTPPSSAPYQGDGTVPDWWLGLTLAERLALVGATAGPAPRRRGRARWREERRADIARARKLASRIAAEPAWWREFRDIYRAAEAGSGMRARGNGFLAALGPLIAQATAKVRAQLSGSRCSLLAGGGAVQEKLLSSVEQILRNRLSLVVTKTLVLELAVARRQRLLKGDTPEARFAFFCECLGDPAFSARVLAQYPVLVRRCMTIAAGWEEAIGSMLARIAASEPELISGFFGDGHPGRLMSAEASGDVHGRGQAVTVLGFESGARLVYKPRPMAMERCYYELVARLNDRGLDPALKVVRTLDEGAFGWMEFVPSLPCRTGADIQRFFRRMGAHLALTTILGATDLHYENVIAHGEHPVPVDLETLFHGTMPDDLAGATARGWAQLRGSVVRTLLLPEARGASIDPDDWVDISALGQSEDQLTAVPVANWAQAETDRMRLIYARRKIPPGLSLPRLAGQQVQSAPYADDVVGGFGQAYELLRESTTELLAPQGPLSAFAGKPVRRVLRDTSTYIVMLFASCHPRFQRDAIACEAMLRDALRNSGLGLPWLKSLEDVEVADLLTCDIPYLVSTVGSNDVMGIAGQPIAMSGKTEPSARIAAMSERDLERQAWLIRVAMQDVSREAAAPAMDRAESPRAPSPQTLIATAARIGDRICELAIQDGDRCTWLVPDMANSRRMSTTVAGPDLYDGLCGIALFLAHLGVITGEGRYGRIAEAATREALWLHGRERVGSAWLGAFQGIGSFCYALVHLAAVTGRREYAAQASASIRRYVGRATRATDLDLITGLAGFIVAALVVARHNRDSELVEMLRPAVERLDRLTAAAPRHRTPSVLAESQTGLAHGRAGPGLALLRWAESTGEAHFKAAGEVLIAKDLAIMETARRNSTNPTAIRGDPVGWCRGSLGIAIAALAARPPVANLFDVSWAKGVAKEMVCSRPSRPLCLCHGALGRLEFLSFTGRRLMRKVDPDNQLQAWRAALLGEIVGGRWVADFVHALETPTLMTGLAGTGYALLRQAVGERVPSVLVLANAEVG